MPVVLKPRRSSTAGAIPTTLNLADGELAVNTADRKIYVRSGAAIVDMLDNLAPKASPTFTGTPTVPTAAAGTNTTQAASTAFVQAAVTGSFVTLNTAQTISAVKTFSASPLVPTAALNTNTTAAASTAHVFAAVGARGTNSLNTVTRPGFYDRSPSVGFNADTPEFSDVWHWAMHHEHSAGNYGFQLVNPIGTSNFYLRNRQNGVWAPYVKIVGADNPSFTGVGKFSRNAQAANTIFGDLQFVNIGAYDNVERRIEVRNYNDNPTGAIGLVANSGTNFYTTLKVHLNNTLSYALRHEFTADAGYYQANVQSGAPATPSGGGITYWEAGAYKAKNPSGIITTLAGIGTGLSITWNPSDKHADIALSESNMRATNSVGGTWRSFRGHALHTSLKSYFEIQWVDGNASFGGIADITHDLATHLGNVTGGTGGHGYALFGDGTKFHNAVSTALFSALVAGDVGMFAFDPNTRKLWLGKNGTWSGDPAAGTGEAFIVNAGYTYYPAGSGIYTYNSTRLRTTAGTFSYAVPSGFYPAAG